MRYIRAAAGLAGIGLAAMSLASFAADGDLGKTEYDSNCAVCHGVSGKGDGPLAGMITQKVPNLTTLAKSNNGVFPFNGVYEVIDGRTVVKGHGTRDMPVWGNDYNEKAVQYHRDYYRAFDAESFVRGRILALVGYIYSLQEK
jgi:mono/diheme cytochrome c family protein